MSLPHEDIKGSINAHTYEYETHTCTHTNKRIYFEQPALSRARAVNVDVSGGSSLFARQVSHKIQHL